MGIMTDRYLIKIIEGFKSDMERFADDQTPERRKTSIDKLHRRLRFLRPLKKDKVESPKCLPPGYKG